MLELRSACERCGVGLPGEAAGAWICSFECTFCTACATGVLTGRCPNCRGDLEPRPTRSAELLRKYPAVVHQSAVPARATNPTACGIEPLARPASDAAVSFVSPPTLDAKRGSALHDDALFYKEIGATES